MRALSTRGTLQTYCWSSKIRLYVQELLEAHVSSMTGLGTLLSGEVIVASCVLDIDHDYQPRQSAGCWELSPEAVNNYQV